VKDQILESKMKVQNAYEAEDRIV